MAGVWRLVLSHDGTILGAADGAPASWVGTRLADHHVPEELLKEADVIVVDALPLRRAPTDLRAVLQSALEVMQRQAKTWDVSLTIAIEGQVPALVPIDAEKIAWATTALVGNAFRYVHHGSHAMPGGSIAVRVAYHSVGPEIVIEVQDDGPGIPADKLHFLFRDEGDRPHLGLALSMIREIVAAHGGHLEVQSDTEAFRSGTTIRLTLPV